MESSIQLASRNEIKLLRKGGTEVVQQRAWAGIGMSALSKGMGCESGDRSPARISSPIFLLVRCHRERIWKASSQGQELKCHLLNLPVASNSFNRKYYLPFLRSVHPSDTAVQYF